MSYASALLLNIDNVDQPGPAKPPQITRPAKKQQPQGQSQTQSTAQAQQSKPEAPAKVVKLEGNDGGDLGKLIRDEKSHVYVEEGESLSKKQTDRIFEKIKRFAGIAASAALGQTCHYFFNAILANRAKFYKHKATSTAKVNFQVDYADQQSAAKSVPLSFFNAKKTALGKYWFRVVSQAQQQNNASDPSKDVMDLVDSKPVKVTLNGGFILKADNGPAFYVQKDLATTLTWLKACIALIADGKKTQEVPSTDCKVILSRYGLGGGLLKVETVFPGKNHSDKKAHESSSVHHFEFSQFCIALHFAAKEFLPLVGTCVQELPKGTAKEGVESGYVEREKILKDLLKHKELGNAVNDLERGLHKIPGQEVANYMREQTVQKVRLAKQQAQEAENIRNFLKNNAPDDWEDAKRQAESLNRAAAFEKEERFKAKIAAREAEIAAKKNKNKKDKDANEEVVDPKKPKKVVKKFVDDDGFETKKVFVKTGDVEKEVVQTAPTPKVVAVAKPKETTNVLENNPYSAALLAGSYISMSEEQSKSSLKKVRGREAAEEKKRAQINKEKKAALEAQLQQQQAKKKKVQQQGKGKPTQQGKGQQTAKGQQGKAQPGKGQQVQQKGQQAQQKGQQKGQQAQQKGQQAQPKAQQKTPAQAKTQPATPKQKQANKNNNKGQKGQKGKKQIQKSSKFVPEPSSNVPTLVVALVGLVAFGYVFVFSGAV